MAILIPFSVGTTRRQSTMLFVSILYITNVALSCRAFSNPAELLHSARPFQRSFQQHHHHHTSSEYSRGPLMGVCAPSARALALFSSSSDDDDNISSESENDDTPDDEGIDLNLDPRLYKIRMPRAAGIDWGTDLSFSFVYVRGMDPSGVAAASGIIKPNDQLCEIQAVPPTTDSPPTAPINTLGAPFDFVMTTFGGLGRTVQDTDLVFFRGTKDELKAACSQDGNGADPETVTITVIQNKGAKDEETRLLQAPAGANVRQLLVDNGINVYQSVTRWTNCKGKQLCGTCIVNIKDGSLGTNRKSMDEDSTLRENPDSYRLSCVTFAYGDVTVETFPPVNPAQWTR
jgi:ferredoxin